MADVFLVAIVEVEKADRIICQARACGHGVYRRIHIVLVDGQFTLLGSDCFQRLYGAAKKAYIPYYQWHEGRRLTDEERQRLMQNTVEFIAQLEAERLQHQKDSIKSHEAAPVSEPPPVGAAARPADRPRLVYNTYERSAQPYEGPEVLRWKWRLDQASTSAILATCKADPSPNQTVAAVAQCYEKKAFTTPYSFALDVELYYFLPKKNTLRLLHELRLIEQD
jgi:hypothetical protein